MFDFPKTTGEILASWKHPTWVIPQWALSPKKHDPRKNMRANKARSRLIVGGGKSAASRVRKSKVTRPAKSG